MNRMFVPAWIVAILGLFLLVSCFVFKNQTPQETPILVSTDAVPLQYVGKLNVSGIKIRLLVLKHCFQSMADDDAELVIQGANLAATKGLDIRDIGNRYINGSGEAGKWGEKYSLDKLKDFVSQQMKINAEAGDTLIIFTVGHGSPDGYLQDLGQRKEVMEAFAAAAQENNQETIWWQLSCFASADLPSISSLPPVQQKLFSVVVSSDAKTESPAYIEGKIMQKFFVGLADNFQQIDTNNDGMVTAEEMSKAIPNRKIFSLSKDQILFGFSWARRIPIIDRSGENREYPKDFIMLPK